MTRKLKIISYNICTLPKWINIYSNPFDRIHKIIDLLNSIDADIICLQELFDRKIIDILIQELIKYNFYYNKSKYIFNSGLMILSKFPIIDKGFETFINYCGEDTLVNKGFIYNNNLLTVFNTHLNSDSILSTKKRCRYVRLEQMNQIKNHIKNKYLDNDILLCGDLNMKDHKINKINELYKYNINSDDVISKLITHRKKNIQIDYIYYLYNSDKSIEYKYDINRTKLSNHNSIILILEFI